MNKRTILLVEDNSDDEKLTLRALKKNKILNEVVVARDGQEAVDFLFSTRSVSQPAENSLPHVILLDLKLPKVDGWEVLKRIRQNEKTTLLPVVVLTSSKEEKDIILSYRSGANSYIRKPVDFVQFSETIRQIGLYWLDLNESAPAR